MPLDLFADTEPAPKPTSRTTVLAAIAALGAKGRLGDDGRHVDAAAHANLNLLAGQEDEPAAQAARLPIGPLVKSTINWSGENRSSKTVVKSVIAEMTGTNADGTSRWPNAIATLSYAAIWAPYLQPDRLARVIDSTVGQRAAYAPIRNIELTSKRLGDIIGRYNEDRREKLAITLFHDAHHGRWWDHTFAVGAFAAQRAQAAGNGARGQLAELLGQGRPTPEQILDIVTNHQVVWDRRLADAVGAIHPKGTVAKQLARVAFDRDCDGDTAVILAHLAGLRPEQRPAPSVPQMIESLWRYTCDPAVDAAGQYEMPDRPDEWADLYPEASTSRYPFPRALLALHGTVIEVGAPVGEAHISVLRNDVELQRNGSAGEMANCTFGYNTRCANGEAAMLHVHCPQATGRHHEFNIALMRRSNTDSWRVGEVNSKANQGNVPPELVEAFRQIAANVKS